MARAAAWTRQCFHDWFCRIDLAVSPDSVFRHRIAAVSLFFQGVGNSSFWGGTGDVHRQAHLVRVKGVEYAAQRDRRRTQASGVAAMRYFFDGCADTRRTSVRGAGVIHAALQQVVYSPLAGRLLELPKTAQVTEGQILFVLESPDLSIAGQRAAQLAQARAKELVGLIGLPEGESRRASVQLQQEQFSAEARLYGKEQLRLQLTAPFAGVLRDLDRQLAPGVWVQPRQALAIVVDPAHWVIDAYIAESDIARVHAGDEARVKIGSVAPHFQHGHVTEVDASRATVLPHAILDAQSGGPIATVPAAGNARSPRDAIYRVRISLDGAPVNSQAAVGEVVIDGAARAWLPSILEVMVAILIRESGF